MFTNPKDVGFGYTLKPLAIEYSSFDKVSANVWVIAKLSTRIPSLSEESDCLKANAATVDPGSLSSAPKIEVSDSNAASIHSCAIFASWSYFTVTR